MISRFISAQLLTSLTRYAFATFRTALLTLPTQGSHLAAAVSKLGSLSWVRCGRGSRKRAELTSRVCCSDRACFDLLRGQAVERRRRHAAHAEHQVNLPAMMRLVFDHGAQPLSHRDRRVGGSPALLGEASVGQLREQRA